MNFNLDQNKMSELRAKIETSESFDFTKDEKELMFKMAGFDLFANSELRTIIVLILGNKK